MAQYVAVRALNRSSNIRVTASSSVWTISVAATAGNFKLAVSNQTDGTTDTTSDLAYNISAADLKTAIAGLTTAPDIAAANLIVSGGPGDADGSPPYVVQIQGAAADQPFIITHVVGSTPLTGGTGVTITGSGNQVKLLPTVDTVIDLDRSSNRRSLAQHSAIGQWVITAANDDIHNDALPANS